MSDIEDVININDDEDNDDELYTEDITLYDTNDMDIKIDTDKHFTHPILTRYEKTMVVIERTEQISNGAHPLINNYDKYSSVEDIVMEELRQLKIPFIIKRNIGQKTDYYKLSDLELI